MIAPNRPTGSSYPADLSGFGHYYRYLLGNLSVISYHVTWCFHLRILSSSCSTYSGCVTAAYSLQPNTFSAHPLYNVSCFRSILDGGLYLPWLRLLTLGMNAILDIWRASAGKRREAARIMEDDLSFSTSLHHSSIEPRSVCSIEECNKRRKRFLRNLRPMLDIHF